MNLPVTSVRSRSTTVMIHLETVHTVHRCAVQVNLPVRPRSTTVMIHLETVHTVHRSAGSLHIGQIMHAKGTTDSVLVYKSLLMLV